MEKEAPEVPDPEVANSSVNAAIMPKKVKNRPSVRKYLPTAIEPRSNLVHLLKNVEGLVVFRITSLSSFIRFVSQYSLHARWHSLFKLANGEFCC